jgi:hypothetical protein
MKIFRHQVSIYAENKSVPRLERNIVKHGWIQLLKNIVCKSFFLNNVEIENKFYIFLLRVYSN